MQHETLTGVLLGVSILIVGGTAWAFAAAAVARALARRRMRRAREAQWRWLIEDD